VDDTLSYASMLVLMTVMLGCKGATAVRDTSMATWMTMTIDRDDDAWLVFLPDLLKPLVIRVIGGFGWVWVEPPVGRSAGRGAGATADAGRGTPSRPRQAQGCARRSGHGEPADLSNAHSVPPSPPPAPPPPTPPGPCTCIMLAAGLRGGKRQFGGKVACAGSIRNRLALLCAHGALACFLVNRFTINAAPFPNPTKRDIWLHTPLWPGNNPTESISYSQHADGLKYYLNTAGILIRKVRCPAGATAGGRAAAPLLGCSPCGHAARRTAAACAHPLARRAAPPKVDPRLSHVQGVGPGRTRC
jgi:hypothetical protein